MLKSLRYHETLWFTVGGILISYSGRPVIWSVSSLLFVLSTTTTRLIS